MIKNWTSFQGINCTFNTTEDCNLRCKYCYEINKKPGNLSFEKAKKFIDLIFEDNNLSGIKEDERRFDLDDGLIIDLLGGDALMNIDIVDKILKYVNFKYTSSNRFRKHGWRANICSNGTLFEKKSVRDFCEKWQPYLSLEVSIDGCPEIHDKNRIFCNGKGTMSTIMKWWPWFKEHFPIGALETKATCNRDTIPYLFESLKFMHETLGLRWINQNFIMEPEPYTEEDYKLLDEQLRLCTEYCLEHSRELYWGMIEPRIQVSYNSRKKDPEQWCSSSCGIGNMPTLSINGDFYPCFRCLPQSLNFSDLKVGNVDDGIDKDKMYEIRHGSTKEKATKDPKCLDCEYESSCIWCASGGYAEYGEFKRPTHICEIIKLQCKWGKYYREKLQERYEGNLK